MKGLLVVPALVFAIFILINNFPTGHGIGRSVNSASLPFQYAQMLTRQPEEKIQIPIQGIRPKDIANTWHAPRNGERLHEGQDIFAPRGTAVYSATDGYVLRVGQNSLGGNIVSVLGAGGRVYYYAHLDRHAPDVDVGSFVSTESVIGYVGTTGNARGTPPHLHFGVYTMSGAINPLTLF